MPGTRLLLLLIAAGLTAGCVHRPRLHRNDPAALIAVPPPGAVPRELEKVTLPEYVVEAPDQLQIEIAQIVDDPPRDPTTGQIEKDTQGKPLPPIKKAVGLPVQAVSGVFFVQPDGTVNLGIWGRVPVSGLTVSQAAEAIRTHVSNQRDPTKPDAGGFRRETLLVYLDVTQYNSKTYFVIADGGGAGEVVSEFPITGNETVLSAVARVGGLPVVASKRDIWVARRCPVPGQPHQILPVDWIALTQHGVTATNYQLLPGDRVYIKAQRLVTLDTMLARLFSPIERIFGVTLVGASTVNQIQGRGNGFGN